MIELDNAYMRRSSIEYITRPCKSVVSRARWKQDAKVQGCQMLEHALAQHPKTPHEVYSLKKFNKIECITTSVAEEMKLTLNPTPMAPRPSRRTAHRQQKIEMDTAANESKPHCVYDRRKAT